MLNLQDVAIIERIARQACLHEDDPDEMRFESFLSVDQDQLLDLIKLIPKRLPCLRVRGPWAGLQAAAPSDSVAQADVEPLDVPGGINL